VEWFVLFSDLRFIEECMAGFYCGHNIRWWQS
jgi:hypothetical protein